MYFYEFLCISKLVCYTNFMTKNGFSLFEVIIYVAILAIVSGLFVGILSTSTRVQLREAASNEVGTQLNFVLQTIQRLVRESSNIEFAGSGDNPDTFVPDVTNITEAAYIKLRMPKSADDPTCIAWVTYPDKSITLTQGAQSGAGNEHKCKNPVLVDGLIVDGLISKKVGVSPSGFVITKFTNYPGHDSVQIDLTLEYNTTNPQSVFQKKLTTAIGRVSAATFDSSLLPATPAPPGLEPEIGSSGLPWVKAYIKDLIVSGTISQGGNYDGGATRGFMVVGAPLGANCTAICGNHTGSCATAFQLDNASFPGDAFYLRIKSCGFSFPTVFGGICYCQ